MKKMKSSPELQQIAEVMSNQMSNQEDVARNGEKAFVLMYREKDADQLNAFRCV